MKILNFTSPFTREECLRRLRTNVEQERWTWAVYIQGWKIAGNTPVTSKGGVVGKIGETEIRLRRSISKNPSSMYLFGRLTGDGNQTRLRCRVGTHPFVTVFLAFWFGGVFLIGLKAIAQGHSTMTVKFFGYVTNIFDDWWVAPVSTLMLFCVGLATIVICRFWARDDEKFLIDFLRKTIDVRDAERA
jgi:hypothetical protein